MTACGDDGGTRDDSAADVTTDTAGTSDVALDADVADDTASLDANDGSGPADALEDTAETDADAGETDVDEPPPGPAAPVPIRGAIEGSGELSEGSGHTPQALEQPFNPPTHPFMAPAAASNIHNDAWMSDAYPYMGPLGFNPVLRSNSFTRVCATVTFDSRGNIVTVCVGLDRARLYLLDPATLGVIATSDLPPRRAGGTFTDFGGGGYFYLDNQDRAVIPTTTHEIRVMAQDESSGRIQWVQEAAWDLSAVVDEDDLIQSALPDFDGRLWFVTKEAGVVGFVEPETGDIASIRLDEQIANSFAIDADGAVYIASATAMYRFDVVDDAPTVTWRHVYANTGEVKPGQVSAGTGTTPTVLDGGFVAIADNADPINIVVYRTAPEAAEREVCAVPVFEAGASATENSLIGVGRAIFVENNHGYTGPSFEAVGPVTAPGVARVDIREDFSGCDLVWTNTEVMAPTSVPKVSIPAGLMYVISRPTPEAHDWAWTALDVHTGETVWSIPSGDGFTLNNNYAGIAIAEDGTAYVGVVGGIISMRDGSP